MNDKPENELIQYLYPRGTLDDLIEQMQISTVENTRYYE